MKHLGIKPGVLVFMLTLLLTIPPFSLAQSNISLTGHEKKLVDSGEIIVREVSTRERSGRTFEAVGIINAPTKDIVQILTDYEKYPEFMPNVSRLDIIEQRDNEAVLNYTLTLPLGKIKKYRLRIWLNEPADQTSIIEWQLQEWPGLKTKETIQDTTGYWFIREKTKSSSLVLYHVYTDPGPIPFGLGWIVDVLSKNSVPEALIKTKSRTEKFISLDALETEKNLNK